MAVLSRYVCGPRAWMGGISWSFASCLSAPIPSNSGIDMVCCGQVTVLGSVAAAGEGQWRGCDALVTTVSPWMIGLASADRVLLPALL